MSARDAILTRLKAAATPARLSYKAYRPDIGNDIEAQFIAKAEYAHTSVHIIDSTADVPVRLADILSHEGFPRLHLRADSPLRGLSWESVPHLIVDETPPSGDEASLSAANFAIAETGTLAFLSGAGTPSSWHFLTGTEFVLVRRALIVPSLEDVLSRLAGAMPATMNLVTGPSRTADIEQTIERGAHGPRALHVLLTAD
jgi:L-lactate dehydrogenase complex protein LldG